MDLVGKIDKLLEGEKKRVAMKAESQELFKIAMDQILAGPDPESAHLEADDLMVAVLKAMGYDLSAFEKAELWYPSPGIEGSGR